MENNAMETKARLHPLLTAAAISVTVFSAVGVATLRWGIRRLDRMT